MSYSNLVSISSHPFDVYDTDINTHYSRRNKLQKRIVLSITCVSMFLIFVTIGITLGIKLTGRKKELIISTTTTDNQLLSSGKVNVATIHSSTCSLPLYPSYNRFGTTVAGISDASGNDSHHLYWPTCIYLNSKQEIYIGEKLNNRIVKYSPNNTQEGVTIAGGVARLVANPQRLYINHGNDDLYFLDYGSGTSYQVQYLPLNATQFQVTLLLTGSPTDCFGMDLDHNLNIYVSEYHNHRVVKWLSPTYKQYEVVAGNGIQGFQLNQLFAPQGIYLDPTNNDLYITDVYRIQLWPAGSTIGQTVIKGGLLSPKSIKRDCHGNFYVLDENAVKFFSPFIETIALQGLLLVGSPYINPSVGYLNKTDYFNNASDIYLDVKNGDLYVADTGRNRIQKFTINAELLSGIDDIRISNK